MKEPEEINVDCTQIRLKLCGPVLDAIVHEQADYLIKTKRHLSQKRAIERLILKSKEK